MESDLAVAIPAWPSLTAATKLAHRKAWLQARRNCNLLVPDFSGEGVQFNAIAHWLLGETNF